MKTGEMILGITVEEAANKPWILKVWKDVFLRGNCADKMGEFAERLCENSSRELSRCDVKSLAHCIRRKMPNLKVLVKFLDGEWYTCVRMYKNGWLDVDVFFTPAKPTRKQVTQFIKIIKRAPSW